MRRRKSNSKLRLIEIILFCALIFSLSNMLIAQAKIMKVKSENSKLTQKINEIKNTNQKITEKNQILQTTIDEKRNLYTEKMKDVKIAYLTFDDGPSKNTLDILKTLKNYNVKATFFVNGHESLKDLYKKIAEDGHALANHTYSHDYPTIYKSVDNFKNDVKKLDSFLTEITGNEPTHIIRYPGGSNNTVSHKYGGKKIMKDILKAMDEEGYVYFDWNVDSTDASKYRQDEDKIVSSVLNQSKRARNGKAVILMHDLGPKTTTVQALPEIIEGLKEQGFIFDVISKDTYKTQFTKIK
ncbi:polysaccharide deacetylase family protein [Clostridium sp. ZS2-4]|uniref:polysaccharide deacetylase family protein n=1 Tax=Clostridium sp. ZS2-4 TaxID=2987703 RepID=UPI00227CA815|nr:polysaccharide deacetylase family protein [Clostridium sp. ZS2-4]MCY6356460.1 polysaccharide deacetylase [Clostridium sp. ZS2-4]